MLASAGMAVDLADHLFIEGKWRRIQRPALPVVTANGTKDLVAGVPGKRLRVVGWNAGIVAAFNVQSHQYATGAITLTALPTVGSTIAVDDGTQAASVFEFGGVGANVNVTISTKALLMDAMRETLENFRAAMNAIAAGLLIHAPGGVDQTGLAAVSLPLIAEATGVAANVALVKGGTAAPGTAVTGMAGGAAAATQLLTFLVPAATVASNPCPPINAAGYAETAVGAALKLVAAATTSEILPYYVELDAAA